MAIQHEEVIVIYKATGEAEFVIPFNYLFDYNIEVFISLVDSKEKLQQKFKEDYDIIDNSVVFAEPPAQGTKVYIQRKTPISNDCTFLNNTKLPAGTLNYALDKLTMICQELSGRLDNALIYDGDEDIDFAILIQRLVEIKEYLENADELSASVLKAAISAAQALSYALQSRNYRDEAAKFSEKTASDSDINIHNQYIEAHPHILALIAAIQEELAGHLLAYNEHLENFSNQQEENAQTHSGFTEDIEKIDARINTLENISLPPKGNIYAAFGYNDNSQLGVNWKSNITQAPIEHIGLRNVKKVSTSLRCGVAVAGGRIWVTGLGDYGLVGPDRNDCYGFRPLQTCENVYDFVDAVVFYHTALALTKDGKLYSWGYGGFHCLGDGTTINRAIPRHIMPDVTFSKVAAGCRVMLALAEDGNLYSCGYSGYGALGHGVASETSAMLSVISGLGNIIDIAAGGFVQNSAYLNFAAAIQQNDGESAQLYTWGYNGYGQLGHGNTTNYSAPQKVEVDFEPAKVVCGAAHTVVLAKDGKVYISGAKAALQQSANQTSFKLVESDILFTDIAAGRNVTYMLGTDGTLYGMGAANYGCLLANTSTASPIELVNGNVEAIYAGCQNYGCSFTATTEEAE